MNNINTQNIQSLKKIYKDAVENKIEEIKFQDGTILLTNYLKYLIEFLELNNKKHG